MKQEISFMTATTNTKITIVEDCEKKLVNQVLEPEGFEPLTLESKKISELDFTYIVINGHKYRPTCGGLLWSFADNHFDAGFSEEKWSEMEQKGLNHVLMISNGRDLAEIPVTEDQYNLIVNSYKQLKDEATTQEAKDYEKGETNKKVAKKIEDAKKVISQVKNPKSLMTNEERANWESNYNNINNEGGEGYIPHHFSKEEYEYAKTQINELNKQLKELC